MIKQVVGKLLNIYCSLEEINAFFAFLSNFFTRVYIFGDGGGG